MCIERGHQGAQTPEELLQEMSMVTPLCGNFLVPREGHPGAFAISADKMDEIPTMAWDKLFKTQKKETIAEVEAAAAVTNAAAEQQHLTAAQLWEMA